MDEQSPLEERAEHPGDDQQVVVAVRLQPGGPVHEFDAGGLRLHRDDRVLVDTERGPMLGVVAAAPYPRSSRRPLPRVTKKADARDMLREDRQLQRDRELMATVLGALGSLGGDGKLVKVESAADGGKVVVYLAADERIELRDLVRELAAAVGTRVEVKQIGARDAAKVAGGLGVCGRELCCSSWLKEFQPVAVKMVKAQGLALNPSKLAGQCGRLKCCMRYEYQTYVELRRGLPAIGKEVESVAGNGRVVAHNVLKQTVVIRRSDDGGQVEATLDDLLQRRPDA
jgi:cell fate regulator YaaT (PSP1 superfamily)